MGMEVFIDFHVGRSVSTENQTRDGGLKRISLLRDVSTEHQITEEKRSPEDVKSVPTENQT
jgi:hypothetical protein